MNVVRLIVLTAVYDDWESVLTLLPEIDAQFESISATGKVVIVDDGSNDVGPRDRVSFLPLRAIERVEVLNLTRNQGNQRALAIGFGYLAQESQYDYLVVMDADHEDNPIYIPELVLACRNKGSESIVFAARTERSENASFRLYYRIFQFIYSVAIGLSISFGNYCVVPAKLVPRIANLPELWSHFASAIMRSRLPRALIPAKRSVRRFSRSGMNRVMLITHAFSGFAVFAEVIAVRLIVFVLGLALFILLGAVVATGLWIFTTIPLPGWTSLVLGLLISMLFQLLSTVVLVLLLVLTLRGYLPMIPARDYRGFVGDVEILFNSTGEGVGVSGSRVDPT